MKTVAIIVAAGQSRRMGRSKQFIEIGGKPVLAWTLSVFEKTAAIDEIILVVNVEEIEPAKSFRFSKLKRVVAGGAKRQDSVYNGLKVLPADCAIVAIHDGARPFVTVEIVEKAVAEAGREGAVVVGVPVKDTLKQVRRPMLCTEGKKNAQHEVSNVVGTLNREEIWAAQTPQVFKKDIIVRAYQQKDKSNVTDDSMLVEKLGIPVKMVMGSYSNIKITTPEDLKIAEGIIRKGDYK
ncbi:MAG: 2-C-methyl-D-erythritol 4-phosphate cytidylyltransferase [Candidatus Saganbacteria bacterium]|nr:2-C-methyl-D-erythritol 4-phosphate cytidylyltransferase [Candidatus Saganbacteria bacterium]